MAKRVVSVEDYQYGTHGNLLEDMAGHDTVVTVVDDETGKAEEGYGRDVKSATEHAIWRHEVKGR